MASTLKVQNIAHTGGTTGLTVDTMGIVTPSKSIGFRHGQGWSIKSNISYNFNLQKNRVSFYSPKRV